MKQGFVLAALCLTLLSGCMSTGGGNGLNATVDRHEQQIQTLMSQVGQVEQVLPGQAEMWAQMQTMRQELSMLSGRLEEAGASSGGMGSGELARMQDKVSRIEAVVRQMASQLAINVDSLNVSYTGAAFGAPGPAEYPAQTGPAGAMNAGASVGAGDGAGAGTASPAVSIPAGTQAQGLYDTGIKEFDQRRYRQAVVAFKEFTASFPRHKLAGNAHFWEGESQYQLQDYARAAVAYQQVIANFPGSPKIQSAMLKQGMALHNAGKKDAARQRLEEMVKRYPNSPEATRAKQFMSSNK